MIDIISIANADVDAAKFGGVLNPIISNVVYPLLGLMFAVATVVFVYGVLQLVFRGEDSEARDNAKKSILYGTLGLFIMVSAWGIVYLISNTIKGF